MPLAAVCAAPARLLAPLDLLRKPAYATSYPSARQAVRRLT
jgi:putative intracellular protease/amidase